MSEIKWKRTRAGHPRVGSFIDERDGQEYKCVQMGNMVWMLDNLNYAGGWAYDSEDDYNELPYKTQNVGSGSHVCTSGPNNTRARVYSWASAMDMPSAMNTHGLNGCDMHRIRKDRLDKGLIRFQGIAPDGWRLPNLNDIEHLGNFIENHPEYSFFVKVEPFEVPGEPLESKMQMHFWTAEEYGSDCAMAAYLIGNDSDYCFFFEPVTKAAFMPVRCILGSGD